MRRTAIAVAVAVVLSWLPYPARGDETSGAVPPKARTLADRGRALHDAGNYPGAIAAFTQAYVIAPSVALLFNLAQAYRLQGDCDDAALMYRRFLATNPAAEQRALAETHLANVERCLHKIALHIPLETEIRRPAPARPPPAIAAIRSAPVVSHRAQIEKDIGVGLTLGGSVSLAVAAYYALQSRDASDQVAAAYAQGAHWKDIAPIDARGKDAATAAKLFGAGGALGIAGGIITYLIGRHDEQPPIVVSPSRHGVELGVRWAF